MPRPIFGSRGPELTPGVVRAAPHARRVSAAPGKLLTTPRSTRFVRAIGRLDASATLGATDLAQVADELAAEFLDRYAALPLGFVGCCHLGPPYEVHTLTIDGQIVEHYAWRSPMPGPLEGARSLARTDRYLVVEVYTDRMVAVRPDGTVVTVGV